MTAKVGRVKDPRRKPDPAGPTIRTTATVAPSTVEAMAEAPAKRRRRPAPLGRPRTGDVRTSRVDPVAMRVAQELVETGSYSRVVVVSPTEVLVR